MSLLNSSSLMFVDRTVMLGNHRDAWVFGAADPNSGTAVLMELARALSELRQTGNSNNAIAFEIICV